MSGRAAGAERLTLHVAFLGCGFITGLHSRQLARMPAVACSYASRNRRRAQQFRQRFHGINAYDGYAAALADPSVDAVVIAVPPGRHLELTLDALRAGKHVLVEKPAFLVADDYEKVRAARDERGLVVGVGENDHYKPLAVTLRRLLAKDAIGDLVLAQFTSVALRPKRAQDWRNDEELAGGDAFFEEGIHWLHLAGSLGPRIVRLEAFRPKPAAEPLHGDTRTKSILVAFDYDTGATGSLCYSREIPSLARGVRWSKLYGRQGVISFESNGGVLVAPGRGPLRVPRVLVPGVADIRGYRAMWRDFVGAVEAGSQPQMGLEQALADQLLMEMIR